jgi:hypothetical protein
VAGEAAGRFWDEHGDEATGAAIAGGRDAELLPARLAANGARALDVDGAGLSVFDGDFRVPLGASDDTASYAERLQFTQGHGPCLEAALGGQIVIAGADGIRQRWPQFGEALYAATPYRAVISVPLSIMSTTRGAMDLFLVDEAKLSTVLLADVAEVSAVVVQALRTADDRDQQPPAPETDDQLLPSWLTGQAPNHRRFVWLAVGMTMASLDINADDALAALRAYAYGNNQLLDDVARSLLDGRLQLNEVLDA